MQRSVRKSSQTPQGQFMSDEFSSVSIRNWRREGKEWVWSTEWVCVCVGGGGGEGREWRLNREWSLLPYPGRSKMSSSSYQTGQDCLPYQMDSLIAAVPERKDREKYLRFENCNISMYTAIRNMRAWETGNVLGHCSVSNSFQEFCETSAQVL